MPLLDPRLETALIRFAAALIDQDQARIVINPHARQSGYWFGGGNMAIAPDGTFYLVGRFRDAGDSRLALAAGPRGLELVLFASTDRGRSFDKALAFAKSDLSVGDRQVLSIEGSALRFAQDGVELFVSTEKNHVSYPPGFENYLKPGAGVWSIDRLSARSIDGLPRAERVTVLESCDPRFVHVKDPRVYTPADGGLVLLFCTHPYCWTSSNTAYAVRPPGHSAFDPPVFDFFPRGLTWDVAISRGTCLLDVPRVGAFRDIRASLLFYDGGECVRNHHEHEKAVSRPRGYSCEELGGAACCLHGDLSKTTRLSPHLPLFVSPHGTGCSRYVDVLATDDGFYATWQQSQPDGSQPLVLHYLAREAAEAILRAA